MGSVFVAQFLILVTFACLALSWIQRDEACGRWSMAWALLAATGAFTLLSEQAPALLLVSYATGSLFPFVMLSGAFLYAERRPPRWLVPTAIVVAVLRVSLAWLRVDQGAAAIALAVEPALLTAAAWLVATAAYRDRSLHHALVAALGVLAAIETYDGFFQLRGSDTASVPWAVWIVGSVPVAAVQVWASLQSARRRSAGVEQALHASEARLRDAQRVARLGSFQWRSGAASTTCSEETLRMLGLTGGPEVSNDLLFATLQPAHLARTREVYTAALRAREPFETAAQVVLNGDERLLVVRIEPSFAPSGELLGVSGTVRDVTEARHADEALRKSEERLRAILSSLGNTRVAVLGRSGQVREVYGDSRAGRRYGLPPLDTVGASAAAFVRPEDLAESRRIVEEVFATGEVRALLRRVELPNGVFWFDTSVSPLRDPSGTVGDVLIVARDVTDQRKAEEERRKVEARMLQAQRLESLGILAGGIAHDFNNLLVGVLGNAELALREVGLDSPASGLLHEMQSASERAAALTRQLLAYAGKTVVSPRSFDLGAFVAETLPLLRTSLPAGTELRVSGAEGGPWVWADDAQLGQVVLNLVTNAAEALGEKGGKILVQSDVVSADESDLGACIVADGLAPGEYACLEVSDTGCGIPAEDIQRIFDPFFTTKFSGRGLGLAAVLGIVRSHGGALQVVSGPGSGSRFRVLLPIAKEAALAQAQGPVSRPPARGAKLLVVDDEPMVRGVAVRMLRSQSFEVIEAGSAREALALFAEDHDEIDAVLLDLTMPDTDGIQLLDALRKLRPGLPAVLMSGHSPEDALERVAGRSYATCLPKPFTLAALASAIDRVLEPAAHA